MALEYFSLLRGRKPTDGSTQQDPKSPVLNEEDEQFLRKVTSEETPPDPNVQTVIMDNGKEVKGKDAQVALMDGADKIPLPSTPPVDAKAQAGEEKSSETDKQKRTLWSYIPTVPVPSTNQLWKGKAKQQSSDDAQAADEGTTENLTDEEKVKQEQKELTTILDQLNLAAVNNRAFSFSTESQKLMEEFTQVLKDMINGVPTAYDDMEQLLRRYDAQLKKMFGDMPPFVKALVKSLPAKVMSTLGPELMAASSEKPGFDAKMRMEAEGETDGKKKSKKSKIPSVKNLATQQGAVAGMLRSIVNFLQARFPAFVTGTNVVMSLAVFLLLFVFYYCHKRGREVRLSKEAAAGDAESGSDLDKSVTDLDESAILEKSGEDDPSLAVEPPFEDDASRKMDAILNQKDPVEVPMPESPTETKTDPKSN